MGDSKMDFIDFRAAYLAAGPNVARILSDTFAPVAVDTDAVLRAASRESLEALAETNVNYIIFPYDLGFPPSEARVQWEAFAEVTRNAAALGMETLALVTPGSYVAVGEYKKVPWTARMTGGKKPVWYSRAAKRVMACWSHDEWAMRVEGVIHSALDAGATGIFLDLICFGNLYIKIADRLIGSKGCHCSICQKQIKDHVNLNIIKNTINDNLSMYGPLFDIEKNNREKFENILQAIKSKNAGTLIGAIINHSPYVDSNGYSETQRAYLEKSSYIDIFCTENHRATDLTSKGLMYDTIGLKVLKELMPDDIIHSSLSYKFGPSPDAVPSKERYMSEIAGAFATGVAPIIRAGEFRDKPGNKIGDYLTEPQYAETRGTIAALFNWLDKNRDIFDGASPTARVGIFFDRFSLMGQPYSVIRQFFNIAHTLTETQIPVRFFVDSIQHTKDYSDLNVIIVPGWDHHVIKEHAVNIFPDKVFLFVGGVPAWAAGKENCIGIDASFMDEKETRGARFARSWLGRRLIKNIYSDQTDYLGGFPISRRAGLPPPILGDVPEFNYQYFPAPGWKKLRDTVTDALKRFPEDVTIEAPPYIHVYEWKKPPAAFFHVFNLLPGFSGPNQAALRFPAPVSARVIDTLKNKITYVKNEVSIVVKPEPYTLVEVKDRYKPW
jgi:hypothetical protein